MGTLTILGLGPGAADQLTAECLAALAAAPEVWLRTSRHPVVAHLAAGPKLHSFDDLYDRGDSFAAVYETIAQRVLDLARRPEGVVYAVPGHPLVAESTVTRLLALAKAAGLPVRIVAGLSFLEPTFSALGLDPFAEEQHGLQLVDATAAAAYGDTPDSAAGPGGRDPFVGAYRPFDPTRPALVCQLYGARLAGQLKVQLLDMLPPEHPVTLVRSAGIPGEEATSTFPLHELDRRADIDHLTSLYVPPVAPLADLKGMDSLRRIVARLRAPDGCPWDREQTHESLKRHVIEEAYEVLDALDGLEKGDSAKLCEELGDLLLQIVLHAQLALEYDEFTLDDVVQEIGAKLIRRHPHVFGDVNVRDAEDVLKNWDAIKKQERAKAGESQSTLASVPKALPALQRAQTIQKRATRSGFDWRTNAQALAKVREELDEFLAAESPAEKHAELGDLLFAVVGLARKSDLDAEEALRDGITRFVSRFERFQERLRAAGRDPEKVELLSIEEVKAVWDAAK